MVSRKVIAVADAGPIIHLDEIDFLHILKDFEQILIPDKVIEEINRHRPDALIKLDGYWQQCNQPIAAVVAAVGKIYPLHAGETAALAVCMKYPDALFLSDDTDARLAAKALDIEFYGTLGLLVRTIRRQQMTKEQVIDVLRKLPEQSSLHLKSTLLQQVIQCVMAQ